MKELPGDDILRFLNWVTEGKKPQTRRIKYADRQTYRGFLGRIIFSPGQAIPPF
jgi:hypothetical protein